MMLNRNVIQLTPINAFAFIGQNTFDRSSTSSQYVVFKQNHLELIGT